MGRQMRELPVEAQNAISTVEFRLEWLEREVGILEQKIQFFDDLSFKIKGWAITTWSALVTYALTKQDWRVACVAVLIPILFLLVDASYKRYQVCFIERTREIMGLLNDPDALKLKAGQVYPFVVYDLLGIHGKGRKESSLNRQWGPVARLVTKASVGLVYWVLIIISAAIIFDLTVAL